MFQTIWKTLHVMSIEKCILKGTPCKSGKHGGAADSVGAAQFLDLVTFLLWSCRLPYNNMLLGGLATLNCLL